MIQLGYILFKIINKKLLYCFLNLIIFKNIIF